MPIVYKYCTVDCHLGLSLNFLLECGVLNKSFKQCKSNLYALIFSPFSKEANNPATESPRDPESAPKRTDERNPPRQLQQAVGRAPTNHTRRDQCEQNQRHLNYYNYHGNLRLPANPHRQLAFNGYHHRDPNRYIRQLYQQRNLPLIIAAQNCSLEQSHIPHAHRLQRGLSNTTDSSFA